MNSLDWKPISQDPEAGYGWFAVALLPTNHKDIDLAETNEGRNQFGFHIAWFNDSAKPKWWSNGRPMQDLITHWTEPPQVPTLTEKPE